MCLCGGEGIYLWRPEGGVGYSGAGVTGDFEAHDKGTGNSGSL